MKRKEVKASALLSSMLVLSTCLIFLSFYLELLKMSTQCNQLLQQYLR